MSIRTNNRYSNLLSNTILFAISGFGSKILSIVLTKLITSNLTKGELGAATNIVNICNVILPIMYLCISEAIIRYGMDDAIAKSDVFTTGIIVTLAGYVVVWLAFPLIKQINEVTNYMPLVYLFIISSAMRTVSAHFVRAQGKVRIFAIDGIVTSVLNFACIIIFIVVLDLKIVGYVLATIIPDIISTIFLSVAGRNFSFFSPSTLDTSTSRIMLRYSIPLVPAAVSWWITSASNRIMLTRFIGEEATGAFEAANKVPQLLIIVSTIFIQAWQISAFSETDPEAGRRFFSRVFNGYSALVFLAGSGIILLIKPLTNLLVAYEDIWIYSPYLIVSVVFSCLVTFLGTIYNYHQKNAMVTITTVISAVLNVAFNLYLIPKYQLQGAAVATCLCYLIVLIIRLVDTRRFMKLSASAFGLVANLILLIVQAYVSINQIWNPIIVQIAIFIAVFAVNFPSLLFILRMLMGTLYKRKQRREK